MKTYYHITNDCEHCSCGHRHRTTEAARKCIPRMLRKRKVIASAVRVEKVSN